LGSSSERESEKEMTLRELWWDWNPKRLRRLLKQARSAIDANANGWANTHQELVQLKDELRQTRKALQKETV
jgi:hypothetical protein